MSDVLLRHCIKGHRFRICAATHASENVIQNMGRWKSDAVKWYLRTPAFFMTVD